MDLVSIIIPVYNQEKFLEKSISSALSQTYRNIQIVCVNDGSTDASLRILENFERSDHRIIIVNQKNGGLAHAVTTGVKNATGKYICFLDSDDFIGADFVQNAMDEIGDSDFVAFSHYIDNESTRYEKKIKENLSLKSEKLEEIRNNLVWDKDAKVLASSVLNSRWNKLYKKSLIDKFIDKYDFCGRVSFGEDTIFTYLMLKNATSGEGRRKTNSYYYNTGNQNSMMSSINIDGHIKKAKDSMMMLSHLILDEDGDVSQAYAMYFFLIESLFQRLEYDNDEDAFFSLYRILRKDAYYRKALNFLIDNSTKKRKVVFSLRKYIPSPRIYKLIFKMNKVL